MKVLDIGCGFGSLAKYMADNCGADVVAFTNSVGMGEEARNRCKGSNVKIQVCDWRDIQGKYDRISSIKMIEHVGGNNWTEFFKKLDSLLNEGGKVFLQSNTADAQIPQVFDFMNRYVFGAFHTPQLKQIVAHSDCLELKKVLNCRTHAIRFSTSMVEKVEENYDKMVELVGIQVARSIFLTFCFMQCFQILGNFSVHRIIFVKKEKTGVEICNSNNAIRGNSCTDPLLEKDKSLSINV
ncbi:cyclopropane-fatty-acyl-phospholipid synthase-like [Folsomia candida]|nr:cyclopropane-fatty-acyl-phospholipid synthase-like [Folsomia candida]